MGPYFSCLHKKSKQKECPLLPVSLRFGQPAVLDHRGAAELTARLCRSVQTNAASQTTKQMRPAAHLSALRSARLRTRQKGMSRKVESLDYFTLKYSLTILYMFFVSTNSSHLRHNLITIRR